MKLLVLLLLLCACSTSVKDDEKGYFTPKKDKNRPMDPWDISLDVKEKTLSNGLKILVVENHHLPIFSYYSFYKVGSKYEDDGLTGASHFLEHMMFKGAKKYGPGAFENIVEGNGGYNNAYTNRDLTVYYQSMPSKFIDKIIDVEADRMDNLLLDPKAFESERNVVLEERRFRYENSPKGKLFYVLMQEVFKGTPYETSVIGKIKDLKTVDRDSMFDYFKTFYAPNSAVIVVVGDVVADKVFSEVEKRYGKLKFSKKYEEVAKKKNADHLYHHRAKYNRWVKIHGESPLPNFIMAFRGDPLGAKRAYILDILSSIVGGGESSYLHKKFVTGKKPLLSNIYVANYNLEKNGTFIIGGELLKGTKLSHFQSRLKREYKKMCNEAVTERSLQKTKNQYMVDYYKELESNAGVAQFVGNREAYLKDYNIYKKELEIYKNMTAKEVKDACYAVFQPKEGLFLSIWDKHSKKNSPSIAN